MSIPLRREVAARGVYWAPYTVGGRAALLVVNSLGELISVIIVQPHETDLEALDRAEALLDLADPLRLKLIS